MKIAVNLISRNRPERLLSTVARTLANITSDDTRLMVSVDDDDASSCEVAQQLARDDYRVVASIEPREDTLGEKYNRVLRLDADVYMSMADYAPYVTPGFDEIILDGAKRFPDGFVCVVNHLENASFTGLYGVSRKLVDAMGFFYPPYFPYWFVDHWVDDVVRLIDRMSFVDIRQDSSKKPGTQELREPGFWGTFFDMLAPVRRECAARIIRSVDFDEAPGRKEALLAHYPLIEYRSAWVNEHLRRDNDSLERHCGAGPGDARYLRVKAKAMAMMRQMQQERAA